MYLYPRSLLKILQWLTFLDTHEKKNTYKNLFVLILYYILAKWLYLYEEKV